MTLLVSIVAYRVLGSSDFQDQFQRKVKVNQTEADSSRRNKKTENEPSKMDRDS